MINRTKQKETPTVHHIINCDTEGVTGYANKMICKCCNSVTIKTVLFD